MLTFRPRTVGDSLHVEVHGWDIVVMLPRTTFKITFQRFPTAPQLMATCPAPRGKAMSEAKWGQLLAHAWKLADDKARELGWLSGRVVRPT
jgi:hypothetical protein